MKNVTLTPVGGAVDVTTGNTLLAGLLARELPVDQACGGKGLCATCHVYVTGGLKTCPVATDDEEDQLDTARGVTPESRLSCQCVPNGTEDVTVVVPAWNKNFAREGHG